MHPRNGTWCRILERMQLHQYSRQPSRAVDAPLEVRSIRSAILGEDPIFGRNDENLLCRVIMRLRAFELTSFSACQTLKSRSVSLVANTVIR